MCVASSKTFKSLSSAKRSRSDRTCTTCSKSLLIVFCMLLYTGAMVLPHSPAKCSSAWSGSCRTKERRAWRWTTSESMSVGIDTASHAVSKCTSHPRNADFTDMFARRANMVTLTVSRRSRLSSPVRLNDIVGTGNWVGEQHRKLAVAAEILSYINSILKEKTNFILWLWISSICW